MTTLKRDWMNTHRDQWFRTGFKAARGAAERICLSLADKDDWRPEDARIAGVSPPKSARRLRQAANNIRNLPPPQCPILQHKEIEAQLPADGGGQSAHMPADQTPSAPAG